MKKTTAPKHKHTPRNPSLPNTLRCSRYVFGVQIPPTQRCLEGKGTKFSEAHIGTKVSDSYGSNGQGLDMRTPTEVTLPLEQGRT